MAWNRKAGSQISEHCTGKRASAPEVPLFCGMAKSIDILKHQRPID